MMTSMRPPSCSSNCASSISQSTTSTKRNLTPFKSPRNSHFHLRPFEWKTLCGFKLGYGVSASIWSRRILMSERNDMFQAISHDHVDSDVEEGRSGPKESIDMTNSEGQVNGSITVEELIQMVKNAETNILMLNEVRTKTLSELEEARTNNDILQSQAKTLKAKLAEADAKLQLAEQSKKANSDLQIQLQLLENKLKATEQLEVEREELKENLKEVTSNLAELEKKALALEVLQKEEEELRNQISALKEAEELLNIELSEVKLEGDTKNEKLRVEIEQLLEVKEAQEMELKMLEKELSEARERLVLLEELKEEKESLVVKVKELEERIAEQEAKALETVQSLVSENDSIRNELQASRDALSDQKRILSELTEKLETANKQLGELSEVQSLNGELEKKIESLKMEMSANERSSRLTFEKLSSEKESVEGKIKTLSKELEEKDNELVSAKDEIIRTLKKVEELSQIEKANEGLTKTLNELREKYQLLGDKSKETELKLAEEVAQALEEMNSYKVQSEKLGVELEALQGKLELTLKELERRKEVEEDNEKLGRRIVDLEKDIQNKIAEQESRDKLFSDEKLSWKKAIEEIQAKLSERNEKIQLLESSLQQEGEKCRNLEEKLKLSLEESNSKEGMLKTQGEEIAKLKDSMKDYEAKSEELSEEQSKSNVLAEKLRIALENVQKIETRELESMTKFQEELTSLKLKNEKLTSELSKNNEELIKLETVMNEKIVLEETLREMESRIEEMGKSVSETRRLKQKLSGAMAELNELSKKEGLLEKLQDEKRNLEKLVERMRLNQGNNDEVKSLNEKLTLEMAELERRLVEKERLVIQLSEEIMYLNAKVLDLEKSEIDRKRLQEKIKELEQRVSEEQSLKEQKELLEYEFKKLQESLAEIEQVNSRRQNLEEEIEKLKPRLEDAKHMKVEKDRLEKEVKKLQKYLKEAEKVAAEMWRLQQEVTRLQMELQSSAELREQKNILERNVQRLENSLEAAQKEVEKRKDLENELLRAKGSLEELENEKIKKEKIAAELKKVQRLAVKGEKAEQELTSLSQEVKKLKESLQRAEQIEREKNKLEKEVQKLSAVQKKVDELQRDKGRLESDIQKLRESTTKVEVLQLERNRMEGDLVSLRERLAESEEVASEKGKLEREVQRLQANLRGAEAIRKEKATLEQDLRRVQALLEAKEREKMVEKDKFEKETQKLLHTISDLEKFKTLKGELENEIGKLKSALGKVRAVESERDGLQKELEKLRVVVSEGEKLKEMSRELEKELKLSEERFSRERKALEEGLKKLQNSLVEEKSKSDLAAVRAMKDIESLRRERGDLQMKLEEAFKKEEELIEMREKVQFLQREVISMREIVDQSKPLKRAAEEVRKKNQALLEKVKNLEFLVSERDKERKEWEKKDEERKQLKQRVGSLTLQLAESDSLMQSQVEHFQAEMERFQAKLETLALENSGGISLPVGEMPWDFWSDLMLKLDDLMLTDKISATEVQELRFLAWQRNSKIRDTYEKFIQKDERQLVMGFKNLIKAKVKPGMHIIHIAAEMAPVAKVGGLADVVTGLGRALQKKGHLVEIVLPKYDCMDYSRIKDLKIINFDFSSYFDGQQYNNKVWRGIVEGLPVYFIEPHHPAKYFWRNTFYGETDDFRRFTYFCRAALEFLGRTGKNPDIIHCHDWQTALVAPLYWEIYNPSGIMPSAHVVFTCHNFEYQGTEGANALAATGLHVQEMHRQDRMQDNFQLDRINLLKGGFVYSNLITTVSPTYAMEVRGPEGGRGLQVTLASCVDKFHGVLNGIDFEAWDPSNDSLLAYQFNSTSVDRKYDNKMALRKTLGLGPCLDGDKPLVGCITRLVPQKGVHLIRHAIYRTRDQGGQFVLLGSSPVPEIQRDFENIAREFSNHPDIRLVLKYDEALSHIIYAACDIFVIPSIFEPCGLTQLIAMRYGAIPVVRKTGGLADSVFDVDDANIPEDKKNGFTFTATDENGLNYALDRALGYYYNHPEWWQDLVVRAMNMDFSWEESSQKYAELYERTIRDDKK